MNSLNETQPAHENQQAHETHPAMHRGLRGALDLEALALEALPSERQLAWHALGAYGFVHFGVNTYTGREWGDGSEDPRIFNPTHLDPEQWVLSFKAARFRGLVLTAKHHDGFCLWPSETTEHTVAHSACPDRDIVAETAAACRKHGLEFGVYLSPWDQNAACYGTEAYNDFYCAQLTELLTNYGEIFHVWFDGACGEGPGGKRQVYDFPRYHRLVRKLQPRATIFHDRGPDVRWIGNEGGKTRFQEWGAVPSELCYYHEEAELAAPVTEADLQGIYNTSPSIGLLEQALQSRRLVYCPSEVDVSIRPGWFYHEDESPKSPDQLFEIWLRAVGGNACLNLNVPPRPDGRFDPRDVAALAGLGKLIEEAFARPLEPSSVAEFQTLPESDPALPLGPWQKGWSIAFEAPRALSYLVLQEDLTRGQRVSQFELHAPGPFGNWQIIAEGTTVGYRKILPLHGYETQELKLLIRNSRGTPHLRALDFYGVPEAGDGASGQHWVTGRTILEGEAP